MRVLKLNLCTALLIVTFCISKISCEISENPQTNGTEYGEIQGRSFISFANPFAPWISLNRGSTTQQPKAACPRCQCSVSSSKRIVGGTNAEINEFPWAAQLIFGTQLLCGGSLITDNFVLTAAHCLIGFPKEYFSLLFLAQLTSTPGPNSFTTKVAKVLVHPSYDRIGYNNDIALLQSDRRIDIGMAISPVCLLSSNNALTTGESATVIGWGYLNENSKLPSYSLQRVTVPIVSMANCQAAGLPITNNMICAGFSRGGMDACMGDSGGPLHVVRNGRYYQVGIVSFGKGCGRPNVPGVYTKVQNYISWINQYTRSSCFCDGI